MKVIRNIINALILSLLLTLFKSWYIDRNFNVLNHFSFALGVFIGWFILSSIPLFFKKK